MHLNISATTLHALGTLTVKSAHARMFGRNFLICQSAGAVGFYDYRITLKGNQTLLKVALQYAHNFDGTLVHSFPMDCRLPGRGIVNEGEVSTKLGLKGYPNLAEELNIVRDLRAGERGHRKKILSQLFLRANAVKLVACGKKKGFGILLAWAITTYLCLPIETW